MGLGPKVFIGSKRGERPTRLYKWSPDTSVKKKPKASTTGKKYFCVTPNGSQGNDFISNYSYVVVLIDGETHRQAYVQCGYVE
jgi:hypothetical protein